MKKQIQRGVLLLALAMPVASAAPILFNRPVVNSPGNLVTQSPADHSQYIIGDDFVLGSSAVIDTLTVWIVAGNPATTNPAQELSGINLYLGADPGPMSKVSSSYSFSSAGTFVNPNTQAIHQLFALAFSGLNFSAVGGTLYDFAIEGLPMDPALQLALASTACANLFGPCPGDGADAVVLGFSGTPGSGPYSLLFTAPAFGATAGVADIGVRLESAALAPPASGVVSDPSTSAEVPEPSAFALLGIGLGVFGCLRHRRSS